MLINAISLQFTFKDTNSHYTWFILKRQTLFLKSCSRITLPAPIRSLRKWPGTFLLFLYLLQLRYPGHCYINVLYLIPGWIIHHSGCGKSEYILEFFYRCSSSRTINTSVINKVAVAKVLIAIVYSLSFKKYPSLHCIPAFQGLPVCLFLVLFSEACRLSASHRLLSQLQSGTLF